MNINKSNLLYYDNSKRIRNFSIEKEYLLTITHTSFLLTLIFIIGTLVNSFTDTLILFLSYLLLKKHIGILHFNTRIKCSVYSLIIFTLAIFIQASINVLASLIYIYLIEYSVSYLKKYIT